MGKYPAFRADSWEFFPKSIFTIGILPETRRVSLDRRDSGRFDLQGVAGRRPASSRRFRFSPLVDRTPLVRAWEVAIFGASGTCRFRAIDSLHG